MSQPLVKPFENSLGDESLFIPFGSGFDTIPTKYLEFVNDQYREFLEDPRAVLESLAAKTTFESLGTWLKMLSRWDGYGVIVHYAKFNGHVQHDLTVWCMHSKRQRFFRLPAANRSVDDLPYPLNELYRVTDGVVESADAFFTSQFLPFRRLRCNLTDASFDNTPFANPDRVIAYYRTDTGDLLAAERDSVFELCHEDGSVHRCGTVLEVLESYFNSDLDQPRKWNPETDTIRCGKLFDADEYHLSECCPWTFFAYPTALADAQGLPPDKEACELLSHLQRCGIDVAVLIYGNANDKSYFACRIEDRQKLHDELQVLVARGIIEENFCLKRSERLLALIR